MMNKQCVENAVKVLNEALSADSEALHALYFARVVVNDKLASHPSIQVGPIDNNSFYRGQLLNRSTEEPESNHMGLLGLINGLFGVDDDGYGFITAVCEDDGRIKHFAVTER